MWKTKEGRNQTEKKIHPRRETRVKDRMEKAAESPRELLDGTNRSRRSVSMEEGMEESVTRCYMSSI